MSRFTEAFRASAARHPEKVAYFNAAGESMTYGELDDLSERLGARLKALDSSKGPVVMYGHKSPYLFAALLACAKSGRAYVPVDTMFPEGRVIDIFEQLGGAIFIDTTSGFPGDIGTRARNVITKEELGKLLSSACRSPREALSPEDAISGDDIMYIMFTSGSTGKPKGVMMHAGAIDRFSVHFLDLLDARPEDVFFNRVPLSFDISLFDITAGFAAGATLCSLEEESESSLKKTFEALRDFNATQWSSTPSFIEACLADPSFNHAMMPGLRVITLAGEVLRNNTARRIHDAFPGVRLINAYGPTEAESVSEVDITPEVVEHYNPLPVGYMAPGMHALIRDPETLRELPRGQVGEIYLAGCTVAKGYHRNPELTAAAFSTCDVDGKELPCYKTGDKGYLSEDGLLFCLGRYDSQVKVGGFRIELGDIEENLCKLPHVAEACVVPVWRDGSIAHVCAFVHLADPDADQSYAQTRALKQSLREVLPDYMVPRAFKYVQEWPTNTNGKIDRKALAERAGSSR